MAAFDALQNGVFYLHGLSIPMSKPIVKKKMQPGKDFFIP
jgi:hypothetical protein